MSIHEGQQLGNYRLLQRLGAGGFAEVFLGEHIYLNTQAAIKVLQTRLAEEERERFLQEARIIARLIHPHIVRVLEFGVEDEIPFLVMDYAPHGTLRNHFPGGVPLSPRSILPYLQQIALALDYAHTQGLVHRDVKPENMLLSREDEVLLSDFGIALIAQSARFESGQEVFGTATYMAPEQIQGKAEPASDQYSLGIVIYEWLCGKVPFQGTFAELCSQHLFTLPPPLREHIPTITPALEAIVEKALSKYPHDRFQNVQAFALAFEEACQQEPPVDPEQEMTVRRPVSAIPGIHDAQINYPAALPSTERPSQEERQLPPTQAAAVPTPELSVTATTPVSAPTPKKRGLTRREFIIGGAATGLLAAGGLTWFLLSRGASSPSTSTAKFTAPPSPSPSASPPSLGSTLLTYQDHTGAVNATTWSPNGQYIASASTDTTVKVWNISKGDTLYTYHGHTGLYNAVFAVDWSSNGRQIASGGSDRTVQVWDASTGNRAFTFQGHTARVLALAWSPDNRYIASAGADKTVQVWDATNGNLVYTYLGHAASVYTLTWSPDGKSIASGGGDKTVQVWTALTGEPIYTYHGHADTVYSVAFSPDGTKIASGGADRTVQVWEPGGGNRIYTYHGHTGLSNIVSSVDWSPDGKRLASGSTDKTVQLWDATTGDNAYVYQEHKGTVYTARWSHTQPLLASGSADTTVKIWRTL